MKTIPALLLSLSICALAWTIGRAVDRGIKLTVLHIIATPQDVKKP